MKDKIKNNHNEKHCHLIYKKDNICECKCLVNPFKDSSSECVCTCEQEFNLFK